MERTTSPVNVELDVGKSIIKGKRGPAKAGRVPREQTVAEGGNMVEQTTGAAEPGKEDGESETGRRLEITDCVKKRPGVQ